MQWVDAVKMGEMVGYVDPQLIAQPQHTYPLKYPDNHEVFSGAKNKKQREQIRKVEHKNAKAVVATYLGRAMLAYQNMDHIMVPYNFKYD